MELKEAKQTLREVQKNVIYEEIGTKELEAIDIVLKELDRKEEIICAMAEDMTTIMRDGCSPRKSVKYEYIINGYKNLLERKADK